MHISMEKYSRQSILKEIGISGQKKLFNSKVAIIGLGALGTVVSELLCRSGIGNLVLIDRDIVEENNLQRQLLYNELDIGKSKALCAKEKLQKINSEILIHSFASDLNFKNINILLSGADVIIDCTDNLETRFLINDFCMKNNIPWIYGAAIKWAGTMLTIIPTKSPCLRCVMGNAKSGETCETAGIINSVSAVAASFQANEAVKILLKISYEKAMLRFNLLDNSFLKINVSKKKSCPVCNGNYEYLSGKKSSKPSKLCGKSLYQITPEKLMGQKEFILLKKRLSSLAKAQKIENSFQDYKVCIKFKELTIFKDGRTLIKAEDEKKAKSLYSRFIGN